HHPAVADQPVYLADQGDDAGHRRRLQRLLHGGGGVDHPKRSHDRTDRHPHGRLPRHQLHAGAGVQQDQPGDRPAGGAGRVMMTIVEQAFGRRFVNRLRDRPLASLLNLAISLVGIALIAWIAWGLFSWGVVNAMWTSTTGAEACRGATGACWAVIQARWRVILFGLYPYDEQW